MMVTIDLSRYFSKTLLLAELAKEFSFFAGFGNNWDAFWDCISDPGLAKMPNKITFLNFLILQDRLPQDAASLKKCFDDLVKDYPEIVEEVHWALPAPSQIAPD